MTLLEILESLGDRLGILAKVPGTTVTSPAKIETKSVTLADLAAEIRAEEVRSLAELPAELSVPFEKIFETAGIAVPPHGWTIEKLRNLLLTDAFKDLHRNVAQTRILDMLGQEKAASEDLVRDAVARDQALDAFEKFARKKMEERLAARERRLAEIEGKLQELQEESARLKAQGAADKEKWTEWRKQKRAAERNLAWAVGYLIDGPVITTDPDDRD